MHRFVLLNIYGLLLLITAFAYFLKFSIIEKMVEIVN